MDTQAAFKENGDGMSAQPCMIDLSKTFGAKADLSTVADVSFTNNQGVSGLSRQEQNQICNSVETTGNAIKNTVSEGMKCEAPKAAGGSIGELLGAGANLARECMAKLNPANEPDAPQVRQPAPAPVMAFPSPGMAA